MRFTKSVFGLAMLLVILPGCGAIHQAQIKSLHETVQKSTDRTQVLEEEKPFKTIDTFGDIKIDCYSAAIASYGKDGSKLDYLIFPSVENWQVLSETWALIYESQLWAGFANSLNEQEKKKAEPITNEMLFQCKLAAQQAIGYAQISNAAATSSTQTASSMMNYPDPQLSQISNQLSQINNSIQSQDDNQVIDLGPSRASQMGSGFGQGFAAGMMQAQAQRQMRERVEFFKAAKAAQMAVQSLESAMP